MRNEPDTYGDVEEEKVVNIRENLRRKKRKRKRTRKKKKVEEAGGDDHNNNNNNDYGTVKTIYVDGISYDASEP